MGGWLFFALLVFLAGLALQESARKAQAQREVLSEDAVIARFLRAFSVDTDAIRSMPNIYKLAPQDLPKEYADRVDFEDRPFSDLFLLQRREEEQ